MKKVIVIIVGLVILMGCAAHPTISPIPLKEDEVRTAITFSYENILPVFVYRKGISDVSDYGIRIGLPIYGSGIDYSHTVFQRGDFYDIINFAFSLTPNSSFDMTYYSVRTFPIKPGNALYSGFRAMYIPKGINGNESIRVGALLGLLISQKVGIELGYFHDLDKGQPIEKIVAMEPENDPRYPAITDFGFPSENSRLVGLSLQVSLSTAIFQKKK
ncbi:MAG TPA: hypothetical protein ENN20_06340 [Candidatus Marinimicrobia bacterium]|nr:hypothetical protein [Candidatus Neomarinimicrobiota bacterium]